jgi:Protein of unknown function (DUF2939)
MGFISRNAIGVLIFLAVAGWALFYVPGTPSYAIYQLKQAIDARDGASAVTFVDFPSVVRNAGYEMLKNGNSNDLLGAMVGKGAVDLLTAPVAIGAQQWTEQQVNSGARQVQMPSAAVLGAIVMLHRSGDSAWTDFTDNKGRQWDIRMARKNGRWQVVEVKGIEEMLQNYEQQRGVNGSPPMAGTPPTYGAPAPASP